MCVAGGCVAVLSRCSEHSGATTVQYTGVLCLDESRPTGHNKIGVNCVITDVGVHRRGRKCV